MSFLDNLFGKPAPRTEEPAPRGEDKLEFVGPEPTEGLVAEIVHNAPAKRPMWKDGLQVQVELADIPKMQSLGFVLYEHAELVAMAQELDLFATRLGPAAMRFVDAAKRHGVVDTRADAEAHVLSKLHAELENKLQTLISVTYAVYPVRGDDYEEPS